jgi:UDP-N-acetylglucosamine 2-epimerase (non-hydrolysing)
MYGSTGFVPIKQFFKAKNVNVSSSPIVLKTSGLDKNIPRIMIVIGTRPDVIKCAPLIAELKTSKYTMKFNLIIVSTGQHRQILESSLTVFNQTVDIDLRLMIHNQRLSDLFFNVFSGITNQIHALEPSLIIVQGDTTTALAAALAGAYQGVPVAHVEAGLRSFNLSNPFPEELNRKLIDSLSDLMFAPTTFAKEALLREGLCETNIFVTGNTGIDAFYQSKKYESMSRNNSVLLSISRFKRSRISGNSSTIVLVTMHRRENFGALPEMCEAVKTIANIYKELMLIIFPIHPNPNVRNIVLQKLSGLKNVEIMDPIPFDIFRSVISKSDIVMTDSGGIQEEAASIGKPVILLRMNTERPEGIYLGTIKQIGVQHDEIVEAVNSTVANLRSTNLTMQFDLFGDGTASKQIGIIINKYLDGKTTPDPRCTTKARQDAIAEIVYPGRNGKLGKDYRLDDNLTLIHVQRRRQMQNLTKVKPPLTLSELYQLPSQYSLLKKDHENFTLTAIVGMYKRKDLVRRWIEALISQSHPPVQIWITSFASPNAEDFRAEIAAVRSLFNKTANYCMEICTEKNCKTNTAVSTINNCSKTCVQHCVKTPQFVFMNIGEMQLKYFGRFQLALQCHTKYVVVLDDDCIPQPRYFETAMYTINTEAYRGILGTKGTPAGEFFFYGPLSKSDRIIEADVVGGSWFMESDWVKLMFHDKLHSWATGEDFHLCANARKYANIRSFVMPVDPNNTSTHAFSEDYIAISHSGDTTGRIAGTLESRRHIAGQLWLRGDRLMDSYAKSQPSLVLFAERNDDAIALLAYSKKQLASMGVTVSCAISNGAKTDINITMLKSECHSFHDFMIGRDYNVKPTPIGEAAEVMYSFDMVLQGTQSTAVMIMGSSSTATVLAAVAVASIRNIPVVNMHVNEDVVKTRITKAVVAMSSYIVNIPFDRTLDKWNAEKLNTYLKKLFT